MIALMSKQLSMSRGSDCIIEAEVIHACLVWSVCLVCSHFQQLPHKSLHDPCFLLAEKFVLIALVGVGETVSVNRE